MLLAFFMGSMSTTETAVFLHLQLAGSVFLVLRRSVVAVLAFGAGKGNDVSHALNSFLHAGPECVPALGDKPTRL